MALVNRDSALNEAILLVKSCETGSRIELMSYKRNRTVALIRTSENTVTFIENGYIERVSEIEVSNVKKHLKSAVAREFSRSRKIRFHLLASTKDLQRVHQII